MKAYLHILALVALLIHPVRAEVLSYEQFGAVGDARTDDRAAIVKTDVDWGAAEFIIADENAEVKRYIRYRGAFPHQITEEVVLMNVTTASGKPIALSPNKYMFHNMKLVKENGAL